MAASSASAGSLYVSDYTLDTVDVFNSTTGALTGSLTPTGGWGLPSGIAVGPNGDVYVADMFNNNVDQFSPTGAYIGVFATSGLFSPGALAFGPDGNLYVANFAPNGYITRYDSNGNPVDGTPFVPASTGLTYPQGLAFGPNGDLYIGDSNDQIDQVVLPSGAFSSITTPGGGCPGTPFIIPSGLAFGSNGNLYVSDEGAGCGFVGSGVYEYNTSGDLLETIVPPNTLSSPIDLAFGPDGNLYVTNGDATVDAFNGTTGAQMADLVPVGTLDNPQFLAFSSSTPEPAIFGLLGLGFALLAPRRRSA